jgi:hypothetical protein
MASPNGIGIESETQLVGIYLSIEEGNRMKWIQDATKEENAIKEYDK